MTKTILVSCLSLMFAGCAPLASTGDDLAPRSADALIIVDLSSSLTRSQRERIPEIAAAVLRERVSTDSSFAVYALESSMADGDPLLSGRTPNPVTTSETVGARQWFEESKTTLVRKVGEIVSGKDRQKTVSSCYVKSATFANTYFREKASAERHLLVWIGDLIEDCREKDFARFRLARVGAQPVADPVQPTLSAIDVQAIVVPRQVGEPAREVDAPTVLAYWQHLAPKLGASPNGFRIGTPDLFGLSHTLRPPAGS